MYRKRIYIYIYMYVYIGVNTEICSFRHSLRILGTCLPVDMGTLFYSV